MADFLHIIGVCTYLFPEQDDDGRGPWPAWLLLVVNQGPTNTWCSQKDTLPVEDVLALHVGSWPEGEVKEGVICIRMWDGVAVA